MTCTVTRAGGVHVDHPTPVPGPNAARRRDREIWRSQRAWVGLGETGPPRVRPRMTVEPGYTRRLGHACTPRSSARCSTTARSEGTRGRHQHHLPDRDRPPSSSPCMATTPGALPDLL